ncbi:MAG: ATP-binding protein [Actinomycetales bacterium]
MLRTLGIKSRILVLAVPVAVVAVLAVVLGLATGAGATTAVLIGALGVVGVVATIVLGGIVAASITRPLDELGAAADEVSDSLPAILDRAQNGEDISFAEIPVENEDEIGRLTSSVNTLSTNSVNFAKSQAGASKGETDVRNKIANMFVNVARRDQTLLKRLLSQLDTLERSEENPDTLDALFKLDHLATRMRRNAESLLVLAGRETSRRRRQPMPLTDVVRSASSEIEHYERVDLAQYVDPAMLGHSALPTAHLLAELLENATRYSDPGSRVSVETNEGPKGIRITIADTGLGMSAQELERFNDRIANPPTDDVIAAEKLGFYVVGRLAKKLDASVTLTKGETKGTVATVDLAPALFVPGSVNHESEAEPDFGGDATWASAPETDDDAGEGGTDSSVPSSTTEPAPKPARTTATPDFSQAASALSSLANDDMIAPEIVSGSSRPGGLPARGLPARGAKPEVAETSADEPSPAASASASSDAPAAAAKPADSPGKPAAGPVSPAEETPAEAATESTSPQEVTAQPQLGKGEAALPAEPGKDAPPSSLFGSPPAPSPEPARVPAPRSDSAPNSTGSGAGAPGSATPGSSSPEPSGTPEPARGSLFGGVRSQGAQAAPTEAPGAATPQEPESTPARTTTRESIAARMSDDSRSASSTLSAMSRQRPDAPPAPASQPAPQSGPATPASAPTPTPAAAPPSGPAAAPAARPAPTAGAAAPGVGALDIVPTGGRGPRRRKQERGAAPMPNAAAIAAAAATPDEAYIPKAFVPSSPQEGQATPAPANESSLSDVLRARSAMASQALSELSQLSGTTPLVRRERGATEAGRAAAASQARAETTPSSPTRPTRSAADVRSMLSGFQAGVARGRETDGATTGAGGESK